MTLPQSIMLSGIEILRYCIELHSKELLVHKEQSTPGVWILQNKVNTFMSHLSAKSGLIVRQLEKSLPERISPKKFQSNAACKLEELREGITGRAANQLGR